MYTCLRQIFPNDLIFPKEIYFTPRAWAEHGYNIVRWTIMPRGGHFASLEEPELIVNDLRAFFRELTSQR